LGYAHIFQIDRKAKKHFLILYSGNLQVKLNFPLFNLTNPNYKLITVLKVVVDYEVAYFIL